MRAVLTLPLIIILAACRTGGSGSVKLHYIDYDTPSPDGNEVTVCHGYSCKLKTPYKFSQEEIAEITAIMKKVKRDDSAPEERRAVAYAIGAMETKVGNKIGITDNPGMQWSAAGWPSQQDCVGDQHHELSARFTIERAPQASHGRADHT